MSAFPEILESIRATGTAFDEFKKNNDARLKALAEGNESKAAELLDRIETLEALGMAPGKPGQRRAEAQGVHWLKTQAGAEVPYLTKDAQFADLPDAKADKSEWTLGEYCRAAILGGREGKTASGTALVPSAIGALIFDRVRAQTCVVRAGAGTIRIEGPTNLARITQDATVYEHTESAADIVESDILAGAVTLNPKTLVALVPLTTEVVSDSPNLDSILHTALTGAFAVKLDQLAIAAIVAAPGLPVSAAAHDPATWTGTNAAIAAALAVNQELPTAHISTPANYAARSTILASTAGSWLGRPPHLSGMAELFTSSMNSDQAIFGDFASGVAMAVRADLAVEVIRFAKPTSATHQLIAYMRAAPVVLQPARLFWQKKVP